jgi:hypothetical protein
MGVSQAAAVFRDEVACRREGFAVDDKLEEEPQARRGEGSARPQSMGVRPDTADKREEEDEHAGAIRTPARLPQSAH